MKFSIYTIVLFLLFCSCSSQQTSKDSSLNKKQIFLLGTYHFASNRDRIQHELDDMLSDRRQKEIIELVNTLASFKPDKICIEWRAKENQAFTDSLYTAYAQDRYLLKGNEIFQIAFRLAKQLGHTKVYCIDAPGNFRYDTLLSTAEKYNQINWFNSYMDSLVRVDQHEDSLRKTKTVKENLLRINSAPALEFGLAVNDVFASARLGEPGEYGGAEFLAEWYKRNIRMYSNVVRVAEPADKRIFVLVGASHKSIMQHFFEIDPEWNLVDVNDYLK